MMMLGACSKSEIERLIQVPAPPTTPPIKVAIPDLSPADKKRCYDPGVPVGADARAVLADTRLALADCGQKHRRVVKQYADAQKL